jgi:hypothetical protein
MTTTKRRNLSKRDIIVEGLMETRGYWLCTCSASASICIAACRRLSRTDVMEHSNWNTAVSHLFITLEKKHKSRSDKENLFSICISSLSRYYTATYKRSAEFHTYSCPRPTASPLRAPKHMRDARPFSESPFLTYN